MSLTKFVAIVVLLVVAFTAGIWFAILGPRDLFSSAGSATTPGDSASSDSSSASTAPTGPPPSPPPPYTGPLYAFGDYVAVSAQPCLETLGFTVDAKTDRQVSDGAFDLQSTLDQIPGGILIQLGANGGASDADLDQIMRILGPDRTVVWATIQLPDDPSRYTYEDSTNAAIGQLAQRYPNVRILSWNGLSLTNPTWLNKDGSMTKEGCKAYASYAEQVLRAGVSPSPTPSEPGASASAS